MSETEYRLLTSVGGGSWYDLNHMFRTVRVFNKKITIKEFERLVRKHIAYGYIKARKDGVKLMSYKNELGITQKGSDALEYWKRVRYSHTDNKHLLSSEGQAMITLPK